MIFKLAWRNLWRNKRRTLITIASIFFAVLLACIMRSFQEGVYEKMIGNVVSFYTGYIQVHKDGYWDEQIIDNSFEDESTLATKLAQTPGVEAVVPRLESFALASSGEETKGCMVVGIDPEKEDQLTFLRNKLVAGKYLQSGQTGVLVADSLSKKLNLEVGDSIVLLGQGYHGASASGLYPVVGTVRFGSPELNERLIYLPIEDAQEMYGAEGRVTAWAFAVANPQDVPELVEGIKSELDNSFEVLDWKQMMPDLVQMIEIDRGGGILMMTVLYVIIAFGIFGTVLMMTAERKYEFGVLLAIGMKRAKLIWVLIVETIFMGLIGSFAGMMAALPVVLYYQKNPIRAESMAEAYAQFGFEPVFPMAFDLGTFLTQALIVILFIVLISIYPVFKILKTDPVKAMRV